MFTVVFLSAADCVRWPCGRHCPGSRLSSQDFWPSARCSSGRFEQIWQRHWMSRSRWPHAVAGYFSTPTYLLVCCEFLWNVTPSVLATWLVGKSCSEMTYIVSCWTFYLNFFNYVNIVKCKLQSLGFLSTYTWKSDSQHGHQWVVARGMVSVFLCVYLWIVLTMLIASARISGQLKKIYGHHSELRGDQPTMLYLENIQY